MGVEDAGDGVFQQVPVDAVPRRQHRARICIQQVIIGKEPEDNGGKGIDLILRVARDTDCRERVLESEQPSSHGLYSRFSTHRVSSSYHRIKCPVRSENDMILQRRVMSAY